MGHDAPIPTDPIEQALARARETLPDQGPLGVFIHHNTLHAFQHLPFHEAVQQAAARTGARPYLELDAYRAAWRQGRIEGADLDDVLRRRLGAEASQPSALGQDRLGFWRLLMLVDPAVGDLAGTTFDVTRDHAHPERTLCLAACRATAHRLPPPSAGVPAPWVRHADALAASGAGDVDLVVMRELVRLCGGFLDHGQALTAMPGRAEGFLRAVAGLYASGGSAPRGAPGIVEDLARIRAEGLDARAVIHACCEALGVSGPDLVPFLTAVTTALPGWAGMFARVERHPDEGPGDAPASLLEFLAVRLVIERRAVELAAGSAGLPVALDALRAAVPIPLPDVSEDAAVRLFRLAEACGLDARAVSALPDEEVRLAWGEIAAFPPLARRAAWHEAYEGWYRRQVLDALAYKRSLGIAPSTDRPSAQFVFCIDEREESIRRALEEQGSHLETFGAAGFFGVAIDYRGLYDAEPAAHCPVVVVPEHEVHEAPVYTAGAAARMRERARGAWNAAHRGAHRRSRTLTGGAWLSFVLGPLAATIAVFRVLMPRASLQWLGSMRRRFFPLPPTRLSTVRAAGAAERTARGKLAGFSRDEAADRVANLLRSIGMVDRIAPIVVVLGHGSSSLNNPHESAHDCGACGGRRGGANARLFADMANRPDVRAAVAERGITIPADTWFVGGLHDTADDGVHYHDLELLPPHAFDTFAVADVALQVAREMSAQERCRRFHDTPLTIAPDAALRHVEARAAHLGQPRPEYGHCTNAIAVVGRRALTRGLHLDRRAFLVSYDPSIDPTYGILERVLAAVGPVGAGISLEYYFSSVDNERYGCGTKLPHNVTGLFAVMNGHLSDLRTGLPLQMVELHEPMRLLLVVEATPEALLHVAGRQAEVRELVVNGWVQLVSVDPVTGAMHRFCDGAFEAVVPGPGPLPHVTHSVEWHARTRDHVTPALLTAALAVAPAPEVAHA